jgi:hypothetical protein
MDWEWDTKQDPGAWKVIYANIMFLSTENLPYVKAKLLDNDHSMLIDVSDLEGVVEPGNVCVVKMGDGMRQFPDWEMQGKKCLVVGLRTRYETEGG